ncbi:hypothetical protein [Pseudomonas chlororaphis]|uniref:hypothetical protein n=1 Tax=Pseudomonas chlororaphis TaxID=587753 RepID=UPI0039E2D6B1
MDIDEVKDKVNFELGAKISSFLVTPEKKVTRIREKTIPEELFRGVVDILAYNKAYIEVSYQIGSDKMTFDVPLTGKLLTIFVNPFLAANTCRNTSLGIDASHLIQDLIFNDEIVPHFLKFEAQVHYLSSEDLSQQEKLPYHGVNIKNYGSKGQVIGAALYLEAMAVKATEISLQKPKARNSWEQRITKKQSGRSQYKPDFNDRIQHLRENKIYPYKICSALHSLRKARNCAAHNFQVQAAVSSPNPFEHIEVTQNDQDFINNINIFIEQCREMYGEASKAYGKNIFKRYTDNLAGDLNKYTKIISVHQLGLQHSKELEDVFG